MLIRQCVTYHKAQLWFEILSQTIKARSFSVSDWIYAPYYNHGLNVPCVVIMYHVNNNTEHKRIEEMVSTLAYKKGHIQNLTKKGESHVREADRQTPEKVCPSAGEACQHGDGSGDRLCEGERVRDASEALDCSARFILYGEELKSKLDLDCL